MDIRTVVGSAMASLVVTSIAVPAMVNFVTLQPTTPGTPEEGNTAIKGTAISGKVRVGTLVSGGALLRVEDPTSAGGIYSRSAGNGVYAESTGTSGPLIGGQFISRSTGGRGVIGSATATTGNTRGGIFDSKSSTGVGVYGVSSATTGTGVGVLGSATAASGTAIVGINPNADQRVEIASPSGAVYVASGFLTKNYGAGPRAGVPIAYGVISATGSIFSGGEGSGNWSVVKTDTGAYKVSIAGEHVLYGPFTAVCSATYKGYTSPSSTDGNLLIQCWDSAGNLADLFVTFVVYKAVPGALYPPTPKHGYQDDLDWAKRQPTEFAAHMAKCRKAEMEALNSATARP